MGGTYSTHGGEKCIRNFSQEKPKWRRTNGRSRRRWQDNIKMDLKDTAFGLDSADSR
jgi:hypothetical protein